MVGTLMNDLLRLRVRENLGRVSSISHLHCVKSHSWPGRVTTRVRLAWWFLVSGMKVLTEVCRGPTCGGINGVNLVFDDHFHDLDYSKNKLNVGFRMFA